MVSSSFETNLQPSSVDFDAPPNRFIPTGFQSKELIIKAGLKLGDVDQFPNIDVTIDGADEVDVRTRSLSFLVLTPAMYRTTSMPSKEEERTFIVSTTQLQFLISLNSSCQLREKVLAEAASIFILVADSRKDSKILGTNWKQGVPIEVAPFAWAIVFQSAYLHSSYRLVLIVMIADLQKMGCEKPVRRVVVLRFEMLTFRLGASNGQDEGWSGSDRQRVRLLPPTT